MGVRGLSHTSHANAMRLNVLIISVDILVLLIGFLGQSGRA